ncbi:MAG: M56 family metallopeptidase [Gemmatimonadaceae bacterium]|jgi:beta-lactamase regulating signal transducer with metallopeptidase domain
MSAALLLSWITLSTVTSGLIAVVAVLVTRVVGRAVPARVVWGGALVAVALATATQPLRQGAPPMPTTSATVPVGPVAIAPPDARLRSRLPRLVHAPAAALDAALDALLAAAQAVGHRLPSPVARLTQVAWPLSSGLLVLVLLVSYRRQRALVRRCERGAIAGVPVCLSETTGPVVIGLVDPAIVVPRWLLERSDEEQRLVVAHEAAHVAARDPQLLLLACVLAVLMPWNAAAWFLLARLRLAIELDGDARVLASGTTPWRYGQLLIELSAMMPSPRGASAAPAFSHRASHLERRLLMMTSRPTGARLVRRTAALALGSSAILTACGAELPTAGELQGMDVAKAEARIGRVVAIDTARTEFVVDGRKVDAREARALAADSIAEIQVKRAGDAAGQIRITTRQVSVPADRGEVSPALTITVRTGAGWEKQESGVSLKPDSAGPEPLFLVDGRRMSKSEIDKLSPSSIASVRVLKASTAVEKYGADASNGVVEIVRRK